MSIGDVRAAKKLQSTGHDRLLQNNRAMLEYLKSKDGVRKNVR